jgi:hypothetical protein
MGFFDRRIRPPFKRQRDGSYSVELGDDERQMLGNLIGQLRELLTTDSPALVRLFPPPYGDDEERNQGYAVLAGAELIERRLAALDTVESTLHADSLTQEQLEAWMRSVNDIRLVLGTILDVDEDRPPPDPDSDEAPMYGAYEFFGLILDCIVDALSS